MVGCALRQSFPALGQVVVLGRLTVSAQLSRELQVLVGNKAQRGSWHQLPVVAWAHVLCPCREVEEQAGHQAQLNIDIRCQQLVVEVVTGGVVSHRAVADVIFCTRLKLQNRGKDFADFGFQVDFVAEVVVVVAKGQRVVYIAEHRGVGDSREEAIAPPDVGPGVGIDIVL